MKHLLALLPLCLTLSAQLIALSGRRFTLLPAGAREAGLGWSTLAAPEGALDAFDNPAAAAKLDLPELAADHLSWVEGTSQENLAAVLPAGQGALSAGLGLFRVDPFDSTGGLEAPASLSSMGGFVGYARKLSNFFVLGAALKAQRTDFDGLSTLTDLGANVGGLIHGPLPGVDLGFAFDNLSFGGNDVAAWSNRFGLAWHWKDFLSLAQVRLQDGGVSYSLGEEFSPVPYLNFRLGLDTSSEGSWTAGLGWKRGRAWKLDLAYQSVGSLGTAVWTSLSYAFEPEPEKPAPVALPVATPEPSPTPTPQERVKAAKKAPEARRAPKRPEAPPLPLDLKARTDGLQVSLSWKPRPHASADERYLLWMGFLQDANFRKMSEPLTVTSQTLDLGVRGITYYFQVSVIRPDGSELGRSAVKAVELP